MERMTTSSDDCRDVEENRWHKLSGGVRWFRREFVSRVRLTIQFSSRWCLSALESPYALRRFDSRTYDSYNRCSIDRHQTRCFVKKKPGIEILPLLTHVCCSELSQHPAKHRIKGLSSKFFGRPHFLEFRAIAQSRFCFKETDLLETCFCPRRSRAFCSVLAFVSVFMALSTVIHSIILPTTSLSHSVLPVLFLPIWSFQLYISLWKSLSPWYNPL